LFFLKLINKFFLIVYNLIVEKNFKICEWHSFIKQTTLGLMIWLERLLRRIFHILFWYLFLNKQLSRKIATPFYLRSSLHPAPG